MKLFFALEIITKPTQNVAYLWQLGGFFSAASTVQNGSELHFRFINSFIQPSLVGSLLEMFSLLLTFNNRTNCLKALAGVWKFTMKNEITQFLQKSVWLKGLHFRSTTQWVETLFEVAFQVPYTVVCILVRIQPF